MLFISPRKTQKRNIKKKKKEEKVVQQEFGNFGHLLPVPRTSLPTT
jgi:hypothetical protein